MTVSKRQPKVLPEKEPLLTPSQLELLWLNAVAQVKSAPAFGASLELDETFSLLLIALKADLTNDNFVEVYRSATEGESLEWLLERLKHRRAE
jgi:hypothetical protein